MNREEILRKVENGEGLTVSEVIEYQKMVKPVEHHYGKYGTIALKYMEEHNQGKMMILAGELPEYLHNIDKQADDLYETMLNNLSKKEEFKMTGNYMQDLKKRTTMESIIEETILNQLVYEKD